MIKRIYSPMLIGAQSKIFDDKNYVYELKYDGVRAVAYLDALESETHIINKRNVRADQIYPELKDMHLSVQKSCVLDGEIIVLNHGIPDFTAVQKRSLLTNPVKIEIASVNTPVTFAAFDILEYNDEPLISMPLIERKKILKENVSSGNGLIISDFIQGDGEKLYHLAEQYGLEGVVAKHIESIYTPSRRTNEWIKIKNMPDDDFVVCGYIRKNNGLISLVLGQYINSYLTFMAHVSIGISNEAFRLIERLPVSDK